MISSLLRLGRRQLHTIVSTEFIKPSFPTPSHLKTYNLSVYDQYIRSSFAPLITFYPKNTCIYQNSHDQMHDLKTSLSHTLTKYYPFAGRHAKTAPTYVDCNDHGVEFIEASIDSRLSNFLQTSQHENFDQLFPYERTWYHSECGDQSDDSVIPLAIKVNHFECGGVAIAASLSHKIADAYSLIQFLSHWARVCSKKETTCVEPHFISFENTKTNFSEYSLEQSNDHCVVTRSFMFPKTKINELKLKVRAMINKPTRVEVVTWLLYKCAVAATTKNNLGGCFKPTSICLVVNLRDKMMEPMPENSIGNFLRQLEVQTWNEMELKPELFIKELRNQKMKINGIKNIKAIFAPLLNTSTDFKLEESRGKFENAYICSSICGYPAYGIDFGCGAPIKATLPGNLRKNSFLLMDYASKGEEEEGIEALVCLTKQDMDIVQRDLELLLFPH
ncbi:putative deacetylvindoline O-acetyltransferase [Helianthus annuus]|uniref:Deacetylvindoline O-acetyltransferase n=1 Tax=Helianthus annuus TaxID=4232 RepID=A0A251SCG3_HELAN|nr:acylsugar acyltransferase 3 [Helianthus annuus]KAF5766791.1 putative deacetylvindoline O-acetyltransferase [Helianthus annuus]KAJ0453124.1 putative deacetylvindoline O-acetyltransferase [Helianthus annuus]KAJ0458256.1 putative deacetylvindoline O-acetyltransferase [Helianthus annuus]KAJ0475041.1 putative deacetylvindoline O-acetyltransferase [Helianthus annuus]KAJ0650597.1 putative deacetylvindoline O-acetyltransferase [Helianthus annuus]